MCGGCVGPHRERSWYKQPKAILVPCYLLIKQENAPPLLEVQGKEGVGPGSARTGEAAHARPQSRAWPLQQLPLHCAGVSRRGRVNG